MREILFRGIGDKGYLVEFTLFDIFNENNTDTHMALIFESNNEDGFFVERVLKSSIEQFTGLTDKNGAKVFEGDVLMYEGSYEDYVVLYRDDLSRFCVRRKSGGCTSDLSSFYTIIGNIHEGDK
jgi:hypothetical protein